MTEFQRLARQLEAQAKLEAAASTVVLAIIVGLAWWFAC